MSDTYTDLEDWINGFPVEEKQDQNYTVGNSVDYPAIESSGYTWTSSGTDASVSNGWNHIGVPNPYGNGQGSHTITTNNSGWAHIEADDSALRIRTKDGEEITGEEIILMKKFLEKDPDFQKFKKQIAIKKALKDDE